MTCWRRTSTSRRSSRRLGSSRDSIQRARSDRASATRRVPTTVRTPGPSLRRGRSRATRSFSEIRTSPGRPAITRRICACADSLDFYGDLRIGGPFAVIGGFNRDLGWATTNNDPLLWQVYALTRTQRRRTILARRRIATPRSHLDDGRLSRRRPAWRMRRASRFARRSARSSVDTATRCTCCMRPTTASSGRASSFCG